MIELNTRHSEEGREEERVELFRLNGQAYTVPAKPRVNASLQLLRDTRKHGVELAQLMLLEKMLGQEAYDALCDFEDLKPEDLKALSEACAKLSLGSLESAAGNSETAA